MGRKNKYQRGLTPEIESFNPLELTETTRSIVCDGASRKYTDFYTVGVYGGIATGYTVGCNLRCFFCWVGPRRDRPESYGEFYSPEETAEKIVKIALREDVDKARISGGEPTLGRKHLLEVLGYLEGFDVLDTFILETNGILFGNEESYVEEIERFELPSIRVSLKAGFSEEWERKTGAEAETLELPYKAIEHLWKRDVDFHVAAMVDPRITSKKEMLNIYKKVSEVSENLSENIEWESIDMYPNTQRRLDKAEVELEER